MDQILTMNNKERERIKVLSQITERKITVSEASEVLGISERQGYRILKRYREQGDIGIIHKLRGRSSNRGYPQELREKVTKLYWKQYRDYGATLYSEMLLEYHQISVDHETIRRWLLDVGGANIKRKKRPHRRKRDRRNSIGSLVQFDGSPHDWFEGRGPECVLLHAIDDASNRVFLRFAPSENTADVLAALRLYCERYGIPAALYVDHGTVFYAEKQLTDVGRAMKRLGVEMIYAHSPQAKGRVERGNRTQQDRLVKALRREGISTIAQANKYLDEEYCDKHNQRFAVNQDLIDIHRSVEGYDLDAIFCFQTERQVRNDYTITLNAQVLQLLRGPSPLPPPRQMVTVRRYLNGSLHLVWKDHELNFEYWKEETVKEYRKLCVPKPTHPWRKGTIGKGRYAKLYSNTME